MRRASAITQRHHGLTRTVIFTAPAILLLLFWFWREQGEASAGKRDVQIMVWFVFACTILIAVILRHCLRSEKISLERCAVLSVALLGLVYMVTIQPLAVPDEYFHYRTSYHISNYLMFQEDKYTAAASDMDFSGFTEGYNTSEGYQRIIHGVFQGMGDEEQYDLPGDAFSAYPLMYLPQAIGISLGRLLHTNFLWLVYLGRLCNLLVYAACVYLAVRVIPIKKGMMYACGMLPMALQQAASLSYDAFTNGMALLYIALIVRAIKRTERMNQREYLALMVTGMLFAPAKVGYALIAALLFLIPSTRFSGHQRYLRVGLLLLAMIAMVAAFWLPATLNGTAVHLKGDTYDMQFILEHPLTTLDVFTRSMENQAMNLLFCSVGFAFGGLSLLIPMYVTYVYLLLLFLFTARDEMPTEGYISRQEKMTMAVVVAVIWFMTMMTELLTWTTAYLPEVDGLQGRYLIPLIPLALMAMEHRGLARDNRLSDRKLLRGMLSLHVLTVAYILLYTLQH